jgi:hypothetical protein
MFLFNKYTKWYFAIINKPRTNVEVAENHHIIPKSLGGSNRKENIVCLTPKEHFVCHWLLTKMTFGENRKKMCYAFWSMTRSNKKMNRSYSSLEYSVARRCFVGSRKGKSYEEIFGEEKAQELRESRSKTHKGLPKPYAIKNLENRPLTTYHWQVTHPCGKVEIIENMSEFCRSHNLSPGNMSGGKSKGYTCKKLEKARTQKYAR